MSQRTQSDRLGVRGFTSVLEGVYRKLVLLLRRTSNYITDALSIILQLLGEELEAASWLIKAWSIMELVELYNKE